MSPRPDAVDGLLMVLKRQYPEKPVAAAAHNEAIRELSSWSTKVEIYMKDDERHTFYVNQIATKDNLTIMLTEGAKRPYIVTLPMENTFVGRRYFTTLTEWRSRHILSGNIPVESVNIDYTDSTHFSFQLNTLPNDQYSVKGNTVLSKDLNTKRVQSYLRLLDNIFCMGFETSYIYKDSIVTQTKPIASMQIQRKGKAAETLSIFFKPMSQDTKEEIIHQGKRYDSNYFLACLNNKDFIQLNRKTIETLHRRYQEFYEDSNVAHP